MPVLLAIAESEYVRVSGKQRMEKSRVGQARSPLVSEFTKECARAGKSMGEIRNSYDHTAKLGTSTTDSLLDMLSYCSFWCYAQPLSCIHKTSLTASHNSGTCTALSNLS